MGAEARLRWCSAVRPHLRIPPPLTLQADDLWLLVREVQRVLQARYKPRGFEFGVQDGKLAGQSVPHVHVHVLPNGHV